MVPRRIAVLFGVAALAVMAIFASRLFGPPSMVPLDGGPAPVKDEHANELAAPTRELQDLLQRIDALEERLDALESGGGQPLERQAVGPEVVASAPSLTPDQFIEQYREPVNRLIESARLEEAWKARQEELGGYLPWMLEGLHLAEDSRLELKQFLYLHTRPLFELSRRWTESDYDREVAREIAEPLEQARRSFHDALMERFGPDPADRIFAGIALQEFSSWDSLIEDVHLRVEGVLRRP